jgi:hypothetical protein
MNIFTACLRFFRTEDWLDDAIQVHQLLECLTIMERHEWQRALSEFYGVEVLPLDTWGWN